jgi:putative endonuclease
MIMIARKTDLRQLFFCVRMRAISVWGDLSTFMKNFYYTYVLLSLKDDKFYVGYADDLENRIKEHNAGRVDSTRDRRPFKLVYCEACLNKADAIKREKYFKTGFGRRFLNNRLENYLKEIK